MNMEIMPAAMAEKIENKVGFQKPIVTESFLREESEMHPELTPLIDEMVDYAHRYVKDVWHMDELVQKRKTGEIDIDEWQEQFSIADQKRSQLHDTYIDSVAILLRNMNARELDTEWAKNIAPAGKIERVACGKMAIMLAFDEYRKLTMDKSHE